MTDRTVADTIPPADFSTVVDAVKSALTEGDAGVGLAGVALDGDTLQKSVAQAVENALSISFFDALLKGWYGLKAVRKLTGEEGPMDGKPRVAALATHKLRVTHTPEIHLSVGEMVDLRKVSVPVTVEVEVGGVALTVVDRKIIRATAGYIQPSVTVKVEKIKVAECKLDQIEVSGNLLDEVAPAPADA